MGKLTLKEIAGYLPYQLSARLSQQGIFNLDSEYPNENAHKVGFIDKLGLIFSKNKRTTI